MPRQGTPLTDTKIKSLKPKAERYRAGDTGGLQLEVMPSGSKIWRYRYQLFGVRQPPLTIGNYPDVSLADARKQRDEWASLVAHGVSPKEAVLANKAAHLNTVKAFAAEDAHIIFGAVYDEGMGDELRVTVVASTCL